MPHGMAVTSLCPQAALGRGLAHSHKAQQDGQQDQVGEDQDRHTQAGNHCQLLDHLDLNDK
ncbi:hypothetical protein D9M68_887280 [compost metagenome]